MPMALKLVIIARNSISRSFSENLITATQVQI
jgi:hypothetical protein